MKILIAQPASRQIQKAISLMKEEIEGGSRELLQNISNGKSQGVTVEIWDSAKLPVTCAEIKKSDADLFINFNLAGFEQSTLTDGIAYNLLDCKQIHILLEDHLPQEKYLAKQISISMFFYCMDAEYYCYLQEKYPDIPYLKVAESWEKGGKENRSENYADALYCMIREVMSFVGYTIRQKGKKIYEKL